MGDGAAAASKDSDNIWAFPGAPLEIHIVQDVLERLGEEAAARRTSEGLLFGRCIGTGVLIRSFVRIESMPLAAWLDRPNACSAWKEVNSAIVGAYSIRPAEKPAMTADEVRLMKTFLPDPSVFLVVANAGHAPARAGFFFWEADRTVSDSCKLQFPLPKARPAVAEAPEEPIPVGVPPPEETRSRRPMAMAAGAAILAAAAAGWFWKTAQAPAAPLSAKTPAPPLAKAAPPQQSSLGFQVEARARDLLIRWDPASAQVAGSRVALLRISDGASNREIPLVAGKLEAGRLTYVPRTSRIEVRLELFAPDGTRTSEEALAIWLREDGMEALPVSAPSRAASAKQLLPPPEVSPAAAGLPDAPPDLGDEVTAPEAPVQGTPLPILARAAAAPPPPEPAGMPQVAPPHAADSSGAAAPAGAAEFQPPRPIHRVEPVVTENVRALVRADSAVEVRVRIDEQGNVTRVEPAAPVRGLASLLLPPAMAAAKAWRFEPARAAGHPVRSDFVLVFRFPANR
jgi:hypothetical protein